MIKKRNNYRIVKFIVATIIALSTLIFCFLQFSQMNLANSKVKIIIKARVQNTQNFTLYYTSGANFSPHDNIAKEITKSNKFQNITFELPHLKNLRNIRLDFGEIADNIEIKSISIKGYGPSQYIKDNELLAVISPINNIDSVHLSNQIVNIKTNTGDPFIYFNLDCNKIYQKASQGTFKLNPYSKNLKIILDIKIDKNDYLKLYYGENDTDYVAAFAKKTNDFQSIEMILPRIDSLKMLQLHPASSPTEIHIKSIVLKGIGGNYKIDYKDLLHDLKPINDIENVSLKDSSFTIITNGNNPYLLFNFDTNTIFEKVTKIRFKSLPFYYALILSLILFLWIINLNSSSFKISKNFFLITPFLIIIIAPLLLEVFNIQKTKKNYENRIKTAKPQILLKNVFKYPSKYETYFNDNFRLRYNYLKANNAIKTNLLFYSPLPKKVVLGKDKWLFFSFDCDPKYNFAGHLFSENELNIIKTNLEQRNSYLKKKDIPFYVIIPPTKSSVYPEFLPNNFKTLDSKLTQLISYLKEHSKLEIIDVRQELLSAKLVEQVYYKNDTHWNSKGAFIGYQKLINTIAIDFPAIQPIPREALTFKLFETDDGDLGQLLMLKDYLPTKHYSYKITNGFTAKNISDKELAKRLFPTNFNPKVKRNNNLELPKLLMYRDSYAISLIPILSENFKESVYLWTYQMTPEIIDNEKPDIVVLEVVERYFDHLLTPNPPQIK